MPEVPPMVLVDARGRELPRLTRISPCPQCDAPPERRGEDGFNDDCNVICTKCGFVFPPEAR